MQEIVFHVGLPKTGSSALQVFLARNAEKLRARSIDYLRLGEIALGERGGISSGNGAYLARSLMSEASGARMKDPDKHVEQFLTATANSSFQVGIVSSELFAHARLELLSEVVKKLAGIGIASSCIFFIRNQPQFLCSCYVQEVKRHGCREEPDQYARRVYSTIPFINYYGFYQNLRTIFPGGRVICLTYEEARDAKGGICRSFLDALAIASEDLDHADYINSSMGINEISIMLYLNRFAPRMQFSDTVLENRARVTPSVAREGRRLVSPSLVDEVTRHFAESNGNLAREYFHREQLFASPSTQDAEQLTMVDNLKPSNILDFVGGLLVRYDERIARLEERLLNSNT